MDSKQKLEHHQEDYLLMMYHSGMHYVCERIFLNLGLETIRSCQEASLQWRGMFNFYLSSDSIQIKKIISKWLALANNVSIVFDNYNFSMVFFLFQLSRFFFFVDLYNETGLFIKANICTNND